MTTTPSKKPSRLGPYKPTLILHGGAGSISRSNLPPEVYARYHASLLKYLTETRKFLESGASALDAACHAVTLFEDDPLFNCGRGAVFTERGTIEMEASVMVCSLNPAGPPAGGIKRGAAVSLVRNTRHPILLAKEVLVAADEDGGMGGTSTTHCHLSGREVEEWGWKERDLEKKPDSWFWTKKRWEEHRRGLHQSGSYSFNDLLRFANPLSLPSAGGDVDMDVHETPSQGTVGAVCLDSWGNLAVATSTGGLTNKKAGRIGDTPTIGAGFWAEAWDENIQDSAGILERSCPSGPSMLKSKPLFDQVWTRACGLIGSSLDPFEPECRSREEDEAPPAYAATPTLKLHRPPVPLLRKRRRAVAMSGTGNGDSFLRTNAVRTAASICRLSSSTSLAGAITAIAGPNGELQRSAAERWGRTGEGQGGIIGIEVIDDHAEMIDHQMRTDLKAVNAHAFQNNTKTMGTPVFDFNCGGMFRAYYEVDGERGGEKAKIMVFKDEY
ncbi:uncharacterized protein Z518_03827 [Rhinocladiella mackenziei CBS 650.93]|uniref:Asparaginase n=1 Tax=Rhinocladiella mackenziei CBS 650.93 TaxID=1442369 RepID=A0A0D2IJF6_9EURO|nr:uncharacterized protein Z518_03827 [Rhinocladiella mackenziei CBS 650.93]KIX05854.1 hypothetical protein Z518_03827 [Rhinocladiella mackenziei CBS 650.93]